MPQSPDPPFAHAAAHASRFAGARAVLTQAVEQGVFPGAVYGVLSRGSVMALEAVGRFTYRQESPNVATETAYDLASVSKVVATTAMAMLLWQRGRIELDGLVADLLPGFLIGSEDSRRRKVTLRMLLAHASGLPAYAPLFESARTPAELMRSALQMPLAAEPGSVAAYSDLGFILLGKALEVAAGESMASFCRREIFDELHMAATRFKRRTAEWSMIPPTEEDAAFRGRVVQGQVHDENCYVLGGVCGHAGLFAPTLDVLRFAEAMLAPLREGSFETLFRPEAVRTFTRRAELPPGSSRALGWDTPSGAPSSSGTRLHPDSFGHLGYTGTSLWIDPEMDVAIVLLTNRTFPTRENRKIQALRPAFHDVVVMCLQSSTSG